MELTGRDRQENTGTHASRLAAVERAEAYARAHTSTPVSISRLCRVVGLSERGLRNAFYGVRGMSPKRSMLVERLKGARRALTDARDRSTVTGVATRYGFYELGRFAGTYKDAFGETPSETLYGTSRRPVTEHASRMNRHADDCAR
jgi:transcriptional regulator GlxA family with amidase domain